MISFTDGRLKELAEAMYAAQLVRNPQVSALQCRIAIYKSLAEIVEIHLEQLERYSESLQYQLIDRHSATPLSDYPSVPYLGFNLVRYDSDIDSHAWAVTSAGGFVLAEDLKDEEAAQAWVDNELMYCEAA